MAPRWRPAEIGDLACVMESIRLQPHGMPTMMEWLEAVQGHRLSLDGLNLLVLAEDGGAPLAWTSTQGCLEGGVMPGQAPELLLRAWSALASDLFVAQMPEAWWPWGQALLAQAWGEKVFPLPMMALWCQPMAPKEEVEAFAWARLDELDQLVALDRWHDAHLLPDPDWCTMAQRHQRMAWWVRERRVWVRRQGDRVVCQLHLSGLWSGGAELHGFVTHPEHRGKGHARAALKALAAEAWAQGWGQLTTQIPLGRGPLLALFESQGYRQAKEGLVQAHRIQSADGQPPVAGAPRPV